MDERSYGICFGLRDERIPELSEELQGVDLTVAFWPSISSFEAAPQDLQALYKGVRTCFLSLEILLF
jgi:hypothetical protein